MIGSSIVFRASAYPHFRRSSPPGRFGLENPTPKAPGFTGEVWPWGRVSRAMKDGVTFGWGRAMSWGREHPFQAVGTMAGLAATQTLCPHFAGFVAAGMAVKLAATLR